MNERKGKNHMFNKPISINSNYVNPDQLMSDYRYFAHRAEESDLIGDKTSAAMYRTKARKALFKAKGIRRQTNNAVDTILAIVKEEA